MPMPHLKDRAEEYTQASLIPREQADRVIRCIEQERGHARVANEAGDAPDEPAAPASLSSKMSPEQMRAELHDREVKLQSGGLPGRETDQWRVGSCSCFVFHYVVFALWLCAPAPRKRVV